MKMVRMMIVEQIAALKWLQQNIKHFGGNPELVTLFGYRHDSIVIILINCPTILMILNCQTIFNCHFIINCETILNCK